MSIKAVRLHVASAGNECMTHIASLFAEGFRAEGFAGEVVVDGYPLDNPSAGVLSVVVGPHEFFPLHFLRCRPTIELAPTLARVAVLNVEQPGSDWFDTAAEFALRARHVFDISPAGVAEFRRRGIPAVHAPLGYTPSLEAPSHTALASRGIEVLFLGTSSRRRNAFFARHAEFFSARTCHIILSEVHRPRESDTAGYRSGLDRLRLISSARIVLNVHAADRSYFEQHRALLALANGALLLTEPSRHTAPLVEGTHFVSAPLDDLPSVCGRYLDDVAAMAAIARAGHRRVKTEMAIARSCRAILDAVAAGPLHVEEDGEREAVRARLAESGRRLAGGDTPWIVSTNAAFASAPTPAMSVVVTLFNYAQYAAGCFASVAAAAPPPGDVELVIVDDGSTDDSVAVAESFMRSTVIPVQLVRKSLNTGLADARNAGLACARGASVFMLDADNWIYPSSLAVLAEALAANEYAAVYGLIARIEEESGEGVDLISSMDWNPRAVVEKPYIDAMALLDRQSVLDVGGYSIELIDHGWFGWEDYDLWLKLAQAGRACRLVPRLVAAYRDHEGSMLRRTNRSTERMAGYFRTKFAELVARYPGLDTYFGFAADAKPSSPEAIEIARLRDHMTSLEQQLADVYRSKSWRLTAPLRAVLGWRDRT